MAAQRALGIVPAQVEAGAISALGAIAAELAALATARETVSAATPQQGAGRRLGGSIIVRAEITAPAPPSITMPDFSGLLARAFEASVRAARATIMRERLAKMFSRPVQPHGEVVFRKSELCRDFTRLFSVQIYLLQQLAVLRGHHGQEALQTLAEHPFLLLARRLGKFFFKSGQGAAPRLLPAVKINDGPSQNPIEPRGGFFVTVGLPVCRQGFHEAFLHHILGGVVITKAFARERHKSIQIPH
jgi:hypothetical protein